jgi:transposase-like protein
VLIYELLLRVEVQSSSLRQEQHEPVCTINNQRLQQERDILKHATAFFARETETR